MSDTNRILVAVDESEESRRAVTYVAEMVSGKAGCEVGLFHLASVPNMIEWGGSEDPVVEARTETEREIQYRQMEQQTEARGNALLQRMQTLLTEKGCDVSLQLVRQNEHLGRKKIAQTIIDTAKKQHFGTVVVGRHTFSGLTKLLHNHIGERLMRNQEGINVWVVV